MLKRILAGMMIVFISICFSGVGFAGDMEILGVTFPGEKVIAGKTLKLNGVAYRKAFGIVKVFVCGLYLEKNTSDAKEAIESEQVKYLLTHYLTTKATAKKISEGFIDVIEKCNPPDMVQTHKADIEKYASWLDKDMAPGLTSASTYIPGKGLTLEYQGELRGTIPGSAFAQMYYRYN
ncbi:MAG: chalcone isomerase family protein, partial [Deltaproteobacteria bacterium]|nr:chalcone isomerase family protein [Deltaproteobacteria bacterium]